MSESGRGKGLPLRRGIGHGAAGDGGWAGGPSSQSRPLAPETRGAPQAGVDRRRPLSLQDPRSGQASSPDRPGLVPGRGEPPPSRSLPLSSLPALTASLSSGFYSNAGLSVGPSLTSPKSRALLLPLLWLRAPFFPLLAFLVLKPLYVCVQSRFSCVQLCETPSTDCNPPGSSLHGVLQARRLEWVAMPSSRGSSQPRD